MNPVKNSLLLKYWNEPDRVCQYSEPEWELFLLQARATRLAGQWAYKLAQEERFDQIPEPAQTALDAAWTYAEHHQRSLNWEIRQVGEALKSLQCPKILLKGGAYIAQEMNFAQGRLVSDLDFMVPKTHIEQAETLLSQCGWELGKYNPYDLRYYRQWMHEIPPMVNLQRGTTIDMHHNILPETSRRSIDAASMIENSIELKSKTPHSEIPENNTLADTGSWRVLQDVDMVIHSAVHTFQEGEISGSLRDIIDMDGLLRLFTRSDLASSAPLGDAPENNPRLDNTSTDNGLPPTAPTDFWQRLLDRARELHLERPLYYGIHFAREILDTPIPPEALKELNKFGPGYLTRSFMDSLAYRVLTPPSFAVKSRLTGAATLFLYARSHYGRMPLKLLIPHLWHKTFPQDDLPQPDNDGQPMG